MKFVICRTTDFPAGRSDNPPVQGAILEGRDCLEDGIWSIEIDSLDALMSLATEHGRIILSATSYAEIEQPDGRFVELILPQIEIYDGYRE